MLAGLYGARNVAGADADLWSINEDPSFHEEVGEERAARAGVQDRLVPARTEARLDDLLRSAFSRYDEVAAGGAVGITSTLILFAATAGHLLERSPELVPVLSLLGNYLFGYQVSWPGLALGMVESALFGFALGWSMARLVNLLTAAAERDLERRLATLTTLEALDGGQVERT